MRTNRITLAAAAGVTLAAGIATPAAAHTAHHQGPTRPTLTASHAWLASGTAREEAFLAQATSWVEANPSLSPTEKTALTAQLADALAAIKSAAATGGAATSVQDVLAADHTADQAFWKVLRTAFAETATITSAEHEAGTVSALQARLAALVGQYAAHGVQASPAAAEAGTLLGAAAHDVAAVRGAAITDPAAAAADLAAARADVRKAVADIAAAGHALAAALRAAPPAPTVAPAVFVPGTKPVPKPASSPTSTKPCAGRHVAVSPRSGNRDTGYESWDHRGHDSWHYGRDHDARSSSHHDGGHGYQGRQASHHRR